MKKLLIFTDLDGSLLDHHDYSWQLAAPAIAALKKLSYPLVINSSKTAAEISALKKELDNNHPFVCENGAVVNFPTNYFNAAKKVEDDEPLVAHFFAVPYPLVIKVLNELRSQYGFKFSGFHDLQPEELVSLTGLDREQALKATLRQASEPLKWRGDEDELERFKSLLFQQGLTVTKGGRFIHVMSPVNKGDAVAWLKRSYQSHEPETEWLTVGIGDSYNDLSMLQRVDYPILIANPASPQPDVSLIKNIYKTELPGPAGWNQAVLELINSF